jgi:hypothetical protein
VARYGLYKKLPFPSPFSLWVSTTRAVEEKQQKQKLAVKNQNPKQPKVFLFLLSSYSKQQNDRKFRRCKSKNPLFNIPFPFP